MREQTEQSPRIHPKVVVTGGRNYDDEQTIAEVLSKLEPICVAHGNATGADLAVGRWCEKHGVQYAAFPASWRVYGKSAGPIRNRHMLTVFAPDYVVAFPGGRGTANCVRQAREMGIEVILVGDHDNQS